MLVVVVRRDRIRTKKVWCLEQIKSSTWLNLLPETGRHWAYMIVLGRSVVLLGKVPLLRQQYGSRRLESSDEAADCVALQRAWHTLPLGSQDMTIEVVQVCMLIFMGTTVYKMDKMMDLCKFITLICDFP